MRLRAARVFDGERMLPGPTVVEVAGGRIVGLRPDDGRPVTTDLGDVTLLPGLIDAHSHLCFAAEDGVMQYGLPVPGPELTARIAGNARRAVDAGVTTVRDLGDLDFSVVDAAAAGDLPITVVASGPPLTVSGGHCHFLGGVVTTAADATAAVDRAAGRGAHLVKVMCTGGTGTVGSDPVRSQFNGALLRTLVAAAHDRGLAVTAHAHGRDGVVAAVAAGVDGLEHAKFWTDDGIDPDLAVVDRIAERGIWVCPTLGALPGSAPPPPAVAARAAASVTVVGLMHRAGVRLVSGSDAGIAAAKPHGVLPFSVEALVACGVDTVAALRSATGLAAMACGLPGKGYLRPGYDADLIAVDGDPSVDPAALHRLRAVWVAGTAAAGAPPQSTTPPAPNRESHDGV